jgi:aldehyde:ferredoxin oxidoreductase
MLMNLNLKAIAKANDLCNRMGLDSISCGATIAFIIEAHEKGLLSETDMDGLSLTWGNIDAVIQLIEKIAYRKGFGDRAAEGSLSIANSLPEEARDFLVEVKGLELPMHDPRAFHGMGLAYMMSTRGACHLQHSCQAVEQGMVAWDEAGLEEDYLGTESEGKAKMVYISENIGQLANALCICHFAHWAVGMENLIDGFNSVTGLKLDLPELMRIGQRAWVLKRSIGNLMGVRSADDRLPSRVLTPLDDGGSEGTIPDEKLMKTEYYQIRGLNEHGIPNPDVLESLNLGFLKERLYP